MSNILLVSEARSVGGAEIYLGRLAVAVADHRLTLAIPRRLAGTGWVASLREQGIRVEVWSGNPAGLGALGRLARAHDLVHLNLPSTYDGAQGLLASSLKALSGGTPVLTTEHLTRIPRSRRRRWIKLATGKAVEKIITVSEASRLALVAEGVPETRVTVIPNGVPDSGVPGPFPGEAEPLVVAVLASLEPRKQIGLLLRAAADTGESIRVEVAGDGPLRDDLEKLASDLAGSLQVRFHGRVSDPRRILDACHLLALPSRLEAMPLSILEALAAGRGVLASALPGMEEIVIEGCTGRLLAPEDAAVWTAALVDQIRNPALRHTWSLEARRDYERRFTLEQCAARTGEVYSRILFRSGGRS